MHNETMLILGWMFVPMVAYAGGRWAITRTEHVHSREPAIDPASRLEELRRQVVEGRRVPRGRMSEAVRLAESASAPPVLTRQH